MDSKAIFLSRDSVLPWIHVCGTSSAPCSYCSVTEWNQVSESTDCYTRSNLSVPVSSYLSVTRTHKHHRHIYLCMCACEIHDVLAVT